MQEKVESALVSRLKTLRIGVEIETTIDDSDIIDIYDELEDDVEFEIFVLIRFFNNAKILKMFNRIYNDCSCGLEFATRPFKSPVSLWRFIKYFTRHVDRYYLDEYRVCGGHLNFSYRGWQENVWKSWRNITYVSDILLYAFNYVDSRQRHEWRLFSESVDESYVEKYRHIHLHSNRFEIRILDTPRNADNYTLAVFFIIPLFISNKAVEKSVWVRDFDATRFNYEYISENGQDEASESDIEFMRRKLDYVFKRFDKEFSFCERYFRTDIRKAVYDRFEKPAWVDERFNLEKYRTCKSLLYFFRY